MADHNSVATAEGGEAIVQTAVDAFGTVDIVINNAGILRDKTFHNMTPELLEPVIAVHLLGAFYVTQPAWMIMREKGYGRVVNTSSNSGLLGNFGQANYGAAKMGLVGFTRVLANEGKAKGIKANAIAPVAKTRMTEDLLGPLGDKLEPSEVTPTVVYLAHEDCPVNGEVYSVAGGVVARYFIGLTPGLVRRGPHRRGRARQLRADPRRDRLHRPRGPLGRAQEAARDPQLSPRLGSRLRSAGAAFAGTRTRYRRCVSLRSTACSAGAPASADSAGSTISRSESVAEPRPSRGCRASAAGTVGADRFGTADPTARVTPARAVAAGATPGGLGVGGFGGFPVGLCRQDGRFRHAVAGGLADSSA